MDYETVKKVREAQRSAQERFNAEQLLTEDNINKVLATETANQLVIPKLTEVETMIFKMRTELIDYIVAHGLVDGLIWDGSVRPTENGKIVITREMIDKVVHELGYQTEKIKIVDVWFNGISVLDETDRTAKIEITPEDIKKWYESNEDTNAFTDAEKELLATLPKTQEELAALTGRVDMAESDIEALEKDMTEVKGEIDNINTDIDNLASDIEINKQDIKTLQETKVDDVQINDVSTIDNSTGKVIAKITRQQVKQAYEDNPDTNAFDDAAMKKLASIEEGAQKNAVIDVLLDDDSVLDHERHAELTGSMLKESLEKLETVGNLDDTIQQVQVANDIVKPINHSIYMTGAPITTVRIGDDIEAMLEYETPSEGQLPVATATFDVEQVKALCSGVKDVTLDGTSVVTDEVAALTGDDIYAAIKNKISTGGVEYVYRTVFNKTSASFTFTHDLEDYVGGNKSMVVKTRMLLSSSCDHIREFYLPGNSFLNFMTSNVHVCWDVIPYTTDNNTVEGNRVLIFARHTFSFELSEYLDSYTVTDTVECMGYFASKPKNLFNSLGAPGLFEIEEVREGVTDVTLDGTSVVVNNAAALTADNIYDSVKDKIPTYELSNNYFTADQLPLIKSTTNGEYEMVIKFGTSTFNPEQSLILRLCNASGELLEGSDSSYITISHMSDHGATFEYGDTVRCKLTSIVNSSYNQASGSIVLTGKCYREAQYSYSATSGVLSGNTTITNAYYVATVTVTVPWSGFNTTTGTGATIGTITAAATFDYITAASYATGTTTTYSFRHIPKGGSDSFTGIAVRDVGLIKPRGLKYN